MRLGVLKRVGGLVLARMFRIMTQRLRASVMGFHRAQVGFEVALLHGLRSRMLRLTVGVGFDGLRFIRPLRLRLTVMCRVFIRRMINCSMEIRRMVNRRQAVHSRVACCETHCARIEDGSWNRRRGLRCRNGL